MSENGSSDTSDIVVNSQPGARSVVVLINPEPLCPVGANANGSNATSWNVPVTITLASTEPGNDVNGIRDRRIRWN